MDGRACLIFSDVFPRRLPPGRPVGIIGTQTGGSAVNKGYVRLKLKMLLFVAAGSLAAGALGLFLVDVLVDGALQEPFAGAFLAVVQGLFGQTEGEALDLYRVLVRGNKSLFVGAGMMVLLLAAFYVAMGRFTRWLDQVGDAARGMVSDSARPISLPRELRPVEEDLKALQAQLRAREEAARRSEERKRELIAFLAHDLKTPLTSVVGYLSLLRDQPDLDRDRRVKYTGIALDKAERLEELLAEFFDITRMDLGAEEGETGTVRLSVLLQQLADEFYPLLTEKGLRCRTAIAQNLLARGDPDKLARVFDNVLRNAVNYSTPGGTVEIRAEETGARVRIAICNEGLEIPEEELSNIFGKFYRLDAARSTRTGGAGLGLAIAKEIVERHGGEIHAESTGKHTTFVITLPRARE